MKAGCVPLSFIFSLFVCYCSFMSHDDDDDDAGAFTHSNKQTNRQQKKK